MYKPTPHTPLCGLVSIATITLCRSQIESSKTTDMFHLYIVHIQRHSKHSAAAAPVFCLQFGALERSLVHGTLEDHDPEFCRVPADPA